MNLWNIQALNVHLSFILSPNLRWRRWWIPRLMWSCENLYCRWKFEAKLKFIGVEIFLTFSEYGIKMSPSIFFTFIVTSALLLPPSRQLYHYHHYHNWKEKWHYDDVTMSLMASQITSLTIVYPTVYSGVDQREHQSSASLAFVRGIHRGPVNSPHKWPVTRKMFPFDDVIMRQYSIKYPL